MRLRRWRIVGVCVRCRSYGEQALKAWRGEADWNKVRREAVALLLAVSLARLYGETKTRIAIAQKTCKHVKTLGMETCATRCIRYLPRPRWGDDARLAPATFWGLG
ncbi:hypothetical protein IG631_03844 [Alternaria alternata]|nr:hypothetical protein IG631_03844 [Alternaria alternata]